jgi:hypothetical protein
MRHNVSNKKSQAILIKKNVWFLCVSWESHVSHTKYSYQNLLIEIFIKLLDCDWIWIGLSIQFEKWIWIWIANHIFVMDLDWIDNPKKLD